METESPLWFVYLLLLFAGNPLTHLQFSSYIYFSEESRATLCDLPIYVGSVPTEHLDTFDTKLKASFQRIAKEGIDMERMAMVINRDERQV